MKKGSKDQEESASRITGSKSCPSELPKDSDARTCGWRCEKASGVSIPHHPSRDDLFIGKDEACNMNRKKKETPMFTKEGSVYVLDFFVKVPPDAAAPTK